MKNRIVNFNGSYFFLVVPPQENDLKVKVEAGVKKFHD